MNRTTETITQHFAILGFPLSHSISPKIHNLAFRDYGIKAVYGKIEIDPQNFASAVHRLKTEDWQGFNVTIPFKESILAYLDHIDPTAKAIGAVNTIKIEQGKWLGFNTDWKGFLRPIEAELPSLKRCLLIGAGGAARAVAFALIQTANVQTLVIANRTKIRAEKLIESLHQFKNLNYSAMNLKEIYKNKQPFDLIVNTTSVGFGKQKDQMPLNPQKFGSRQTIVYDLIYNPAKTEFLQAAHSLGLRTMNGLSMLIYQAEEAFKIWTGKPFKPETVKGLFKELASEK